MELKDLPVLIVVKVSLLFLALLTLPFLRELLIVLLLSEAIIDRERASWCKR